jgi:NADPH:quinone reductase-like Zn-dependent oxidoreductase
LESILNSNNLAISIMTTNLPTSTKALIHDPKTHKTTLSTTPTPEPAPTQYLIQVHAVGITKGELLWPEPGSLAVPIPGFDVAGTILTAPSPTSKFKKGDRVYAVTSFSRAANAREITVVEEDEIALIPQGLSWAEAASVPMSALTAWQALFTKAGLTSSQKGSANEGKRVLISGASGAVGIWAVQLAKWAGCHVVGICGSGNVEFVKKLGCDEVIDYKEIGLKEWIDEKEDKKFDVLLDGVGGSSLGVDWTAIKSGGILISIVQPVEDFKPDSGVSENVKGLFFIVEPNGKELERLSALVEEAKVTTVVDSVWKLEEYEKAFEKVESGRARGKVIIEIARE